MSDQPAKGELVPVEDALPESVHVDPVASDRPPRPGPSDIVQLMQMALADDSVNVDKMAALVELKIRMDAVEAQKSFNQAMARFRADCPYILKSHTARILSKDGVEKFSYGYATLEDIAKAIDPVLARHGLSYRWGDAIIEQQYIRISCIVTHEAGHTESSSVPMPYASPTGVSDQQKWCSATTYARRQSLVGALGLTMCEVDTDGNDPGSDEKISEAQARDVQDLLDTKEVNITRFLAWAKAKTVVDIPASTYSQAVAYLKAMEPKK